MSLLLKRAGFFIVWAEMKIIYQLVAAFFLLSVVACASERQSRINTPLHVRVLTMADNGSEVMMATGETIKVELEFQGGTGFDWHIDELDESVVKLVGEETKDLSAKGAVGGPLLRVLLFQAVNSGNTTLKLLYYRAWEGKGRAARTFELKLNVANNK